MVAGGLSAWTDIDLLRGVDGSGLRAAVSERAARRRIARLEGKFAVPLVTRSAGETRLTATGRRLLAAATAYRNALDAAAHGVVDYGLAGWLNQPAVLRLAGTGCGWSDWLVDDLAVRTRAVVCAVSSDDPTIGLGLFDDGSVAGSYVWHAVGHEPSLTRRSVSHRVLDEPLWVTVPREHPAAVGSAVSLADLADDDWLAGPDSRVLVEQACAAAGYTPRVDCAARPHSMRRSMLLHGDRVALTSPVSRPVAAGAPIVSLPLREC